MNSGRPQRQAAQAAMHVLWNRNNVDDEDGGTSEEDNDVQHVEDVRNNLQSDNANSSEQEDDTDDEEAPVRQRLPLRQEVVVPLDPLEDKDKTKWKAEAPIQRRRTAADILAEQGGRPTQDSRKDSVLETWQLYFTDDILNAIVQFSEVKANELNIINPRHLLTVSSLKAYIGIMYFRGLNGDQHQPLEDLWGADFHSFYRTAMSRDHFKLWSRVLRFDDGQTRLQKIPTDRFAAIRDIWDSWNERLRHPLVASESITIDEQLIASRTKSPNRIYNPSKPGKYGELIYWLCDSNFRYFYYGHPLTKRPTDPEAAVQHREGNTAKSLVLKLSRHILNTGRNVVGDRFFSSKEVAEELLARQTTYVGTMQKNKRCIPPLLHEEHVKFDSTFVFGGVQDRVTLQSYQTKPKKKCYMISTMHHDKQVEEEGKKKSDIQLYYNSVKSGVDVCDKMAKEYTVRVQCRRWPVVHFQNMLDVTGINTQTIYDMHYPNWTNVPIYKRRRDFLRELANQLVTDNALFRLQNPRGLTTPTVAALEKFRVRVIGPHGDGRAAPQNQPANQAAAPLNQPANQAAPLNQPARRSRCVRCRETGKMSNKCNLTTNRCSTCTEAICGIHISRIICTKCDNV